MQDNLSGTSQELIVAKQELELLREQLSGIESEKSELSEKMAALQRVKEQFSEVQKIFYPPEAMVFRDEYNVFLRLVGLNFDIGKSDIAPEYYGPASTYPTFNSFAISGSVFSVILKV